MICASRIAALALIMAGAAGASGQAPDRVPAPTMPKDNPLPAILYQAEQAARSKAWNVEELGRRMARFGLDVAPDGRVRVKVVGPPGAEPVGDDVLARYGASGGASWRHLRKALVPPGRLSELARALPAGYTIDRARTWVRCATPGEGPPVVHSDTYRDAGADGTGTVVGITDPGWDLLSEAMLSGDAPTSFVPVNYTDLPFQSLGQHGTGCLEAVYDHAPGATYRLYKVYEDVDFGSAVDDAIANGVMVMSNAIAFFGLGWHDDTGFGCDFVNHAARNGILFFTSAGNFAGSHYQGVFTPYSPQPEWHDFGSGDRFIDLEVEDGADLICSLQWRPDGGPYDYDLYLYDDNYDVIASSTGSNLSEYLQWPNDSGTTQVVHLAVVRVDSGLTPFEIFALGCTWLEHVVPARSLSSPANSTEANAMTVGAVAWGNYDVGLIEDYSSWGPTNDGAPVPDLVAPARTSGVAYPGGMGGTSNSTPNAAGAACALWSADLLLDVDAIRWLLMEQSACLNDWGDPGYDPVYGAGGLAFFDHAPNTLWVSEAYGNVGDERAYPFHSVAAAQAAASPGGTIRFLPGGTYPETLSLDKRLTYESYGGTARVGP